MWNTNKKKQEFDGRCCVAPLMPSKAVDRPPMNNAAFKQETHTQNGSTTTITINTRNSYADSPAPQTHNNNAPKTTTTTTLPVSAPSRSARSDSLDSTSSSISVGSAAPMSKPHTGAGDERWHAINVANARDPPLGLTHFRLLKRLGYGDIGSVYLVELRGSGGTHFAMKVMDKASLVSRNKLLRADTERDILGLLDHPFLPTLYTHFETDKFNCLVMEFCSGGNLHSLRQKQPNKYFTEDAARFYASEILLALEYLHMLGIVYRDLKPENVLIRDEGHIMLSDFDLSLRCSVNPTLVTSSASSSTTTSATTPGAILKDRDQTSQGNNCIQPSSFFPKINLISSSKKSRNKSKSDFGSSNSLPELMAEPTNVRSMSFVGTHEYLAPEIIRGEGHGSAVDWWTFGIFLYEMLHGTTPFKGQGNRATLFNVVGQPLKFPDAPLASPMARDLIRGLLVKEPQKRIAYKRGATEVKQHPFFEGVNWALVRCAAPPHVPETFDFSKYASKDFGGGSGSGNKTAVETGSTVGKSSSYDNHDNHGHQNGENNSKIENSKNYDNNNNNNNKKSSVDDDSYVDFEYF